MASSVFHSFVQPVHFEMISEDVAFKAGQFGSLLSEDNDWQDARIVLLGINEWRGEGPGRFADADEVRKAFYRLYHWHTGIKLADLGNVKQGATIGDTYAAIKSVVYELLEQGKRVIIFGGSHDCTLPVYRAFAGLKQVIETTVVDALLDLDKNERQPSRQFLLEMLTGLPNYISQFNLVGFQTYFAFPPLLETIDKLRFDCFRLGQVQDYMEEVEPSIRSSALISIDLNALAAGWVNEKNAISPNGFSGQELVKLVQFAGMSPDNKVTGIFGLRDAGTNNLAALQVAQMIWYYLDGLNKLDHEQPLANRKAFMEYHTLCSEMDTLFLQNRQSGRWWMQLPNGSFAPCSYKDYLDASRNELPERWLRLQERTH